MNNKTNQTNLVIKMITFFLVLVICFALFLGFNLKRYIDKNKDLNMITTSLKAENETLKNNSSKQTSGVMTGIFRIHPNGEDVTLSNNKVIEVSGDQYYVFEETEMYMFGNKESGTSQLSLKDNKVVVSQGGTVIMELTPDYDKEWYTVEVNGTTQYFKKTTEREFYLELLGKGYKEDLAGSQDQIQQLERIRDGLNNEISSAKGQSTGAMLGTYFSDDLSKILEIKENTFSLYAFDEGTNKYVTEISNFPFELQGNNIVSGETEAGTVDLVFVPNYYTDSYSLEGQDVKFIQLPKLLEKYITEGKFNQVDYHVIQGTYSITGAIENEIIYFQFDSENKLNMITKLESNEVGVYNVSYNSDIPYAFDSEGQITITIESTRNLIIKLDQNSDPSNPYKCCLGSGEFKTASTVGDSNYDMQALYDQLNSSSDMPEDPFAW